MEVDLQEKNDDSLFDYPSSSQSLSSFETLVFDPLS